MTHGDTSGGITVSLRKPSAPSHAEEGIDQDAPPLAVPG